MNLYNTLTRRKEEFKPSDKNEAKVYACGPTVYDRAHIGHYRAYIFVDVLRRVLKYNGFQIKAVMNITDVGHLTDDADAGEDKMEKKATSEHKTVWDIAKFYTDDFFTAMAALNVERLEVVCRATDHIAEMIDLIRQIESRGYTYQITDGVYFDTSKLPDYGKLAGLDLDQLREGARVEKNQEKKNPTDFALWKLTPTGVRRQMEWDSPWGKGFPGWHIECTAMGVKYLGRQIDIHTGGMDHIPVHHTNEIAQSEGAFGADVVRFWLHNEFVMVDGEKMSKSKGNFYTLDDIVKRGLNPLAVRYFFLQAHYRTPMNFTWEGVEAGQSGYDRLLDKIGELQAKTKNLKIKTKNHNLKLKTEKAQELSKAFLVAINDDLNTAKGLAILWDLLRDQKITDEDKLALALDFDQVLGLKLDQVKAPAAVEIPAEVQRLVSAREQARQNKDFARSDDLRLQIQAAGFEVKDTPAGQVVREA